MASGDHDVLGRRRAAIVHDGRRRRLRERIVERSGAERFYVYEPDAASSNQQFWFALAAFLPDARIVSGTER